MLTVTLLPDAELDTLVSAAPPPIELELEVRWVLCVMAVDVLEIAEVLVLLLVLAGLLEVTTVPL